MSTVQTVDRGPHTVARSAVVAADAETLFAQVANPHRHGELDGSGTVGDAVSGPERLSSGGKFSVKMKMYGVPYRITSTVTEYADAPGLKVVEWQHPLGHRWRWEFQPVAGAEGTTTVTEAFLYDTARSPKVLDLLGMPGKNAKGIEATLSKLVDRYA